MKGTFQSGYFGYTKRQNWTADCTKGFCVAEGGQVSAQKSSWHSRMCAWAEQQVGSTPLKRRLSSEHQETQQEPAQSGGEEEGGGLWPAVKSQPQYPAAGFHPVKWKNSDQVYLPYQHIPSDSS